MRHPAGGPFLAILAAALLAAGISSAGDVQHLTGDGRIGAGIDGRGRLTSLRWPGLAQWEHVDGGAGGAGLSLLGCAWLVRSGEGWAPLAGDDWTVESAYTTPSSLVIHSEFRAPDGRRSASQKVLVVPGRDVVGVQIRLRGFPPETALAWYSNFGPSTQNVVGGADPEHPVLSHRDFAAWYDGARGILTHFRPEEPGMDDYRLAGELVSGDSKLQGWDGFGKGTYLSVISGTGVRSAVVAPAGADLNAAAGHEAMGDVWAYLAVAPEWVGDEQVASVFVSAAETAQAARTNASAAQIAGWASAAGAAEGLGESWLRGVRGVTADLALRRDILDLLVCIDQPSGGVRYAPADRVAGGVTRVFESVWASAALDALGYTDGAARALRVHLDTVRPATERQRPPGSLPSAIYFTGELARFDDDASASSAAWLLAGYWRHVALLPSESVGTFLEPVSGPLALCAEYLAREPSVGWALAGDSVRSELPLEVLETHYLGLESWRRILEVQGLPESQVLSDRRTELLYLIRIRRQNAGSPPLGGAYIQRWIRELRGLGRDVSSGWESLRAEEGIPIRLEGSDVPEALRASLRCLSGVRRLRHGPPD